MDEERLVEVDWEQNSFGIRTSHSSQDFLNTVNIDRNAPQIIRRKKPVRHKSRRKQQNQSIIIKNFRNLNNPQKQKKNDKQEGFSNRIQKKSKKKFVGSSRNAKKDSSSRKKDNGINFSRLNIRINPRPMGEVESILASSTTKKIKKEKLQEKMRPPKRFQHKNFLKFRSKGFPITSKTTANTNNKMRNVWNRTTPTRKNSILQVKCSMK